MYIYIHKIDHKTTEMLNKQNIFSSTFLYISCVASLFNTI